MKKVAQLSEEDRRDLFSETAAKTGIVPSAIEKDFWLCWVLMIIFEHPDLSKILKLKGGTSLSKCYNLIDRFSEDIDLILDWTVLTKEDPNVPRKSKTKQDEFNKLIDQLAIKYIKDDLLPIIQEKIEPNCKAEIDSSDSHTINIIYPKYFNDEYIKPEIKLEIGPLASMVPFNAYKVKSYSSEVFPEQFEQSEVEVVAITAERTFWEKVTILHAEAHRPEHSTQPIRYSRHYYDVFKMLNTEYESKALANLDLLNDVVLFKKQFYHRGWANYDSAVPKTMKLVSRKSKIASLEKDYEQMKEMIFGDYPEFDEIIEKLESFQNKLNKL
ncbi:MAG: nucleotidyl transferase AbiEii/AbiGii toxin family protein [Thermodesulfobacteriota bacterium]